MERKRWLLIAALAFLVFGAPAARGALLLVGRAVWTAAVA
jgi:hypothetical protein